MKRMEELKQEKEVLARQVEQEEEYLTNTLQQKLETVSLYLPSASHCATSLGYQNGESNCM